MVNFNDYLEMHSDTVEEKKTFSILSNRSQFHCFRDILKVTLRILISSIQNIFCSHAYKTSSIFICRFNSIELLIKMIGFRFNINARPIFCLMNTLKIKKVSTISHHTSKMTSADVCEKATALTKKKNISAHQKSAPWIFHNTSEVLAHGQMKQNLNCISEIPNAIL